MAKPAPPRSPDAEHDGRSRALVVQAPPTADDLGVNSRKSDVRKAKAAAAFSAQIMGQDGVRRGLKGGLPVLEQARSAYLEAEWRGPHDRRMPAGVLRKTEV